MPWLAATRAYVPAVARVGELTQINSEHSPGSIVPPATPRARQEPESADEQSHGAWLRNRDPIEEFDIVAPYIANVHIKDIRPVQGDPEWVPAGEGIVDYAAHFRALRRIGYQGPISLEPHMDFSAEATRRCKEAVEKLL